MTKTKVVLEKPYKYWIAYEKIFDRRMVHVQIGKDLISLVSGRRIKNFERFIKKQTKVKK